MKLDERIGTAALVAVIALLVSQLLPAVVSSKLTPAAYAKQQAQATCSPWSYDSKFSMSASNASDPADVGPAVDVIAVPTCERTSFDHAVKPTNPWLTPSVDIYALVTDEQFDALGICGESGTLCSVDREQLSSLVDLDLVPANEVYSPSRSEGFFDYWVVASSKPSVLSQIEGSPYSLIDGRRYNLSELPFKPRQDFQKNDPPPIVLGPKKEKGEPI